MRNRIISGFTTVAGWIARRSLRSKLLAAFFSVIGSLALVGSMFVITEKRTLDAVRELISNEVEIDALTKSAHVALLNARRYEKEFLLMQRQLPFSEARSRYVSRFALAIADVRHNLAAIRQRISDATVVEQAVRLDHDIARYESGFLSVVELIHARGDLREGVEFELRSRGDEIETLLRTAGDDQLLAAMLQTRHRASEYLSGRRAIGSELKNAAARLKQSIAQAMPAAARKQRLMVLFEEYLRLLDRHVELDSRIDSTTEQYRTALHSLEPAFNALAAWTDRNTQATFDRINRGAQIHERIVLSICIVTVAIAIFGAVAISRAISRNVREFSDFAHRVSDGQLAARLPAAAADEFRELAGALNSMVERLERHDVELHKEAAERKIVEQERSESRRQLEKSLAEISTLSYSLSHDLRAPLRAIDGYSIALLEDLAPHLDDSGRNYLARIRMAAQRVGYVADDMVSLVRLSRRELKHDTVELSIMADSLVAQLRKHSPHRMVQFVSAEGLIVQGDEELLRTALLNLLENAWKFTADQRQPVIEFGAAEHANGTAYFVRDNGIGFDMAYAGKLFKPFQTLHGSDKFFGTGVGLAIVQRVIERHGGQVWAEGEVGKGAAFYFTLNAQKPPAQEQRATPCGDDRFMDRNSAESGAQ